MTLINDIYNISEDEQAGIFTEALMSYFINGHKDVYLPSPNLKYINKIIDNIAFYDCRGLDTRERAAREELARYVANAHTRMFSREASIDWTFTSVLIAFILRHDLSEAVGFIEGQAHRLNVKCVMFQTNEICRADTPMVLRMNKSATFYYETTYSHKCVMELWCSTLFQDDYDKYADVDIRQIEEKYTGKVDADYFIVYFPNLNVVRVKDISSGTILREIPDDI